MNTSGDAAEQVVRLSLEGMEVAAKITGSAAKEVAALLYAALKNRDKNKIKGRQRLTSMLRSGKELTIFTVKNNGPLCGRCQALRRSLLRSAGGKGQPTRRQ